MAETVDGDDLLLTTLPPSAAQKRMAAGTILFLLAAMAVTVPYATNKLTDTGALLPAYAAAVLCSEVITATLLAAHYAILRSPAVLVLAIGYLFTAIMVIPWALSFPDAYIGGAILDGGLQATAVIAAFRRLSLPIAILVYAIIRFRAGEQEAMSPVVANRRIATSVAGTVLLCAVLTWLIVQGGSYLPAFMLDSRHVASLWHIVPALSVGLSAVAIGVLWRCRWSALDLWLIVVLAASLIETWLLGLSSGARFDVGWWMGRVYGLAAASVVLIALLAQMTALYDRLTRFLLAERRTREIRLATMEALAASIAHEINQPLASMVTNANAGLRWLDRPEPALDQTRESLESIVEDGHRGGRVIESIRAMFTAGSRRWDCVDLNDVVTRAAGRVRGEVEADRFRLALNLAPDVPEISANAVQLEQVVVNLALNAIEAMREVSGQAHCLTIETARAGNGVVVTVRDTGPGVAADAETRLFSPFFTTKADGMGVGLMVSKSIIDAHGGRIWASANPPRGAAFQFTLQGNRPGEASA